MECGLTQAEVLERQCQGRVNTKPKSVTNTVRSIITRNLFTIFNFINIILAAAIICVGAYRNALFIMVAVFNTIIGIINELRAKKIVDALALISEKPQKVIRDGKTHEIPGEQIVADEVICFGSGSQIVVDAMVLTGQIEVNEAFITGESDNITKNPGDELLSGSFVVSGSCQARAKAVGADSLINKVSHAASSLRSAPSQLFRIMNRIIKIISIMLIPVGILLFLTRFRIPGTTIETAVVTTVASLISTIPQGLVLLISSVMALSSIRLAKQKVLVQDLYAIETLARVDAICLDKTGTLTTGKMQVKSIHPVGAHSESEIRNVLSAIFRVLPADNATALALFKAVEHDQSEMPVPEASCIPIPFSSERKYSGIRSETEELLIGAIEFLSDDPEQITAANALAGEDRLITVMRKAPQGNSDLLGFVVLSDELRKNATEILSYFNDNHVQVFIISGDSLSTVTRIAQHAGCSRIDAVDLSVESSEDYASLIRQYNIFTRVRPEQKKAIISALKQAGYTVAMTGDGVNDVLAMKEADCSIAIGDGADAARRAAKLVLLGADFTAVPDIIAEGRQTINNLERSATLFLSKTTFAVILSVLFVFLPLHYPFTPIGMSFANFVCIGMPAFILALQPNHERIKNQFVRNIICYSLPTGIVISLNVIAVALCEKLFALPAAETVSIAMIMTLILSIFLIYRISRPLDKLRGALFILILLICVGVFALPFIRNFFYFSIPGSTGWLIIAISTVISLLLTVLFGKIASAIYAKCNVSDKR